MDDAKVNLTQAKLRGSQRLLQSFPQECLDNSAVGQIACLECSNQRLYGEVIQLIPQRKLCWFRPIYLLTEAANLIDLRSSSDLLWPAALFRPALDTEVIEYYASLGDFEPTIEEKSLNHQYLHQFLRQVWRSHQEQFSSKPIVAEE
ncbi:MAG: hypothetical protein AAFQ80_03005 [Cyanobacteria bacterium J06621_8]